MTETNESIVRLSMRELLDEKGVLTYRISGNSMMPLIRPNRDLVTVRKYEGTGLKKYDIAMYERPYDHHYVLHRVTEVYDGYYTFLGDHCTQKEYRIPEKAITATLESFERNGKVIPACGKFFKAYGKIICWLYPIRWVLFGIRRRISRIPFLKRVYDILKQRKQNI